MVLYHTNLNRKENVPKSGPERDDFTKLRPKGHTWRTKHADFNAVGLKINYDPKFHGESPCFMFRMKLRVSGITQ